MRKLQACDLAGARGDFIIQIAIEKRMLGFEQIQAWEVRCLDVFVLVLLN